MRSLQSGVSGLLNHQYQMEVIGNNIANLSTIGFKKSRITFADAISQTLFSGSAPRNTYGGRNPIQFGLGMQIQSVDRNFSQGTLEATGFATDLAISGAGFFTLRDGEKTYYTRAGNFSLDANGNLIAAGGAGIVQGQLADDAGMIQSGAAIEDIVLPLNRKIPAKSTSGIDFYCNLDSSATNSTASLTTAGDSGATFVSGIANNGIGGTHSISIQGTTNAVRSSGDSVANVGDYDSLLAASGVTDVSGFTVTIDAGTEREAVYEITGITANSTVGDLLNALNAQVNGAAFTLENGVIHVERNFAGDNAQYNITLADGTGNLVTSLFGAASFITSGGLNSDLVAIDTFTDAHTGATITTTLQLVTDSATGIVNELRGLGGGGVSIIANDGFQLTGTNPLQISTADTSHATSILVYDNLGNSHTLTMTFYKAAGENEWAWEVEAPEPASMVRGNTGTVTFNENGSLASFNFNGTATELRINPGVGTDDIVISFNAGTVDSFDGITQTNSPFTTSAIHQNGYGMGILENIQIDEEGRIIGNYSNNMDQTLAVISLADFRNPEGLAAVGANRWESTAAAGDPIYGRAKSNFDSSIQSGYLELSNVDLVKEFSDMITAQRAFQANARVITVTDQFLAEGAQLKR